MNSPGKLKRDLLTTRLGFIGLGVMGSSMAKNLLKAGYQLTLFNRNPEKARELETLGAKVAPDLLTLGAQSDCVFLSVSDGQAVSDLVLGYGDYLDQGLVDFLKPKSIIIDFSTISPSQSRDIGVVLKEREISFLDAPVSGGDIGARNGTLTIMLGGEKQAFDWVFPFLKCLAKKIVHVGPIGHGQMTKCINQVAVALGVTAMTEALVLAKHSGLNLETTLDVIGSGAAGSWALDNYAPRILQGNLKPGFYAKHMLKDLRIALEEANQLSISLPASNLVKDLYTAMCNREAYVGDGAELGNHSLITLYDYLNPKREA